MLLKILKLGRFLISIYHFLTQLFNIQGNLPSSNDVIMGLFKWNTPFFIFRRYFAELTTNLRQIGTSCFKNLLQSYIFTKYYKKNKRNEN